MNAIKSKSDNIPNVLIAEDDALFQDDLKELVYEAFPDVKPVVCGSYSEAKQKLLSENFWNLLITDIGLPQDSPPSQRTPEQERADDEKMLGKKLARLARDRQIPCIVATGTGKTALHEANELKHTYKVVDVFSKFAISKDELPFLSCVRNVLSTRRGFGPLKNEPWSKEVWIGQGDMSFRLFRLKAGKEEYFSIPIEQASLFRLFVEKVFMGNPSEEVEHGRLNESLGLSSTGEWASTATPELRKVMKAINKLFVKHFDHPQNLEPWIDSVRGVGYRLNDSVLWEICKAVEEDNVPGRKQKRDSVKAKVTFTSKKAVYENTPRRPCKKSCVS